MIVQSVYLMYVHLTPKATQIRLTLANILEEEHNWSQSAEVLCGIPMDSGQK